MSSSQWVHSPVPIYSSTLHFSKSIPHSAFPSLDSRQDPNKKDICIIPQTSPVLRASRGGEARARARASGRERERDMGLAEEAIGNGDSLGRIPGLGAKRKYIRMDAQVPEETIGEENRTGTEDSARVSESRRYVLACAVFASLNSVLLGYGEFIDLRFFWNRKYICEVIQSDCC